MPDKYCSLHLISVIILLHFFYIFIFFGLELLFSGLLRNFCLSGSGSNMEEVNPAEEESIVHFNQTQESNNKEKALCSPKGIQFQNMAITCKTDAGAP